jgi:hypothetical protein
MTDTRTTAEADLVLSKRRLADILCRADDEAFLLMVWGVDALQSGSSAGKAVFPFGHPPEASIRHMESAGSAFPWELETIVNELLASPKKTHRTTPCLQWNTVSEVVNLVRRIDELDYAVSGNREDVYKELFRISGRQFEWQRSLLNPAQFHRNIFIYGQGACGEHFEEKHGIRIEDFVKVGFTMFLNFSVGRNLVAGSDFDLLGVTAGTRDKALAILAAPLGALREMAARERAGMATMAYRPSVLRRFPCVRFGRSGRRIRAPLPALILERITSGLFYDVITGDGPIRDDYGRRFEQYAIRYLRAMLPESVVDPEFGYRMSRGKGYNSPDAIVSAIEGKVDLVIECKASRMSFEARFADDPAVERGYDDIAKAVFQLWRYFSHCRRGFTGRTLAPEAVGLVLTLDSWMVMANHLFDGIFERAEAMALKSDPLIEAEDLDISVIYVWNRISQEYVELRCADEEYARGMPLAFHLELIDRANKRKERFSTEEERIAVRSRRIAAIRAISPDKTAKARREVARLMEIPRLKAITGNIVDLEFRSSHEEDMEGFIGCDPASYTALDMEILGRRKFAGTKAGDGGNADAAVADRRTGMTDEVKDSPPPRRGGPLTRGGYR